MTEKLGLIILKGLKHRVTLFLHKGDKYICPLCNYSSKDLADIGLDIPVLTEKQVIGGSRRAGGCYKCGSSDRERLIYVYLREEVKIFTSGKIKSIFHVTPEQNLSRKLLEFGFDEYVCSELFMEGRTYPKHYQNINVLDIPYGDNTFDLVLCNHVLEHIPTDLIAMEELRRVLKKDGLAILQVPISNNSATTFEDFFVTDPEQRKNVFGQMNHVRIYGQDYTARLEKSGFSVTRINISKEYPRYGLNEAEDLFVCKK